MSALGSSAVAAIGERKLIYAAGRCLQISGTAATDRTPTRSAVGQKHRNGNHQTEEVAPNLAPDEAVGMKSLMLVCLSNKETSYERQRRVSHWQAGSPRTLEQGQDHWPEARTPSGARWSIRTRLQLEERIRDLALFNLAIDRKLRGCDVVAIRVDDVAPSGYTSDRATVRQKKTGRPVRFGMTEQTRQAIDEYLRVTGRRSGEFLFAGRRGPDSGLMTRQYSRLAGEWVASIGLDPLKLPGERTKVD